MAGTEMGSWTLRQLWTTPDGIQHQDGTPHASVPAVRGSGEYESAASETPGPKAGRMNARRNIERHRRNRKRHQLWESRRIKVHPTLKFHPMAFSMIWSELPIRCDVLYGTGCIRREPFRFVEGA